MNSCAHGGRREDPARCEMLRNCHATHSQYAALMSSSASHTGYR